MACGEVLPWLAAASIVVVGCGGSTTGTAGQVDVGRDRDGSAGGFTGSATDASAAGGSHLGNVDAGGVACECFTGQCAPGTQSVLGSASLCNPPCHTCQPCGATACPFMPACASGQHPITLPGQCCPTSCGPSSDGGAGGAGSGGASSGGAGGTMTGCDAATKFTPDKACASDTDCVIFDQGDCCGTVKVGIRKGTQDAFATANQQALSCIPGCGLRGCFHADVDEEGKTGSSFVATCDTGTCRGHAQ